MITKVSEITVEDLKSYLRISDDLSEDDKKFLKTILNSSINYIKNNTGIDDMDKYSDLVIVVFVLCQDMYDNRTLYVDKNNVNKVVSSFLKPPLSFTGLIPSISIFLLYLPAFIIKGYYHVALK